MPRGNKSLYSWFWSHHKMAAMPYMVKPLKNIFLQSHKSGDFETWHTANRVEPYKVYINNDPWFTLIYVTTRSALFI